MGSELTPEALRLVEGLLSGKGLAELAKSGDPARQEIVRHLQALLAKNPGAGGNKSTGKDPSTGGNKRTGGNTAVRIPPASPSSDAAVILFSDGASRGNPGPAAIGFILRDALGHELAAQGQRIGTTTNNVAEYRALLAGLERARELGIEDLEIRLDSELVVRQLNGKYKVRHPALIELKGRVDDILQHFRNVHVVHVGREENGAADRLANEALDRENHDL